MNKTINWMLAVGMLLLFAGSSLAANHVVTVGGTTLTFTPKSLTINAGDTVTFTNAGGMHNVHSDPGAVTSFLCSVNCTTNNGPSSSAWSTTITFPKAGTIGYYCDAHGSPGAGMFGSITVNSVATAPPPITINGYMSGAWYTVGQGGHGFLIEADKNNNMVAIWFVFSPDGSSQNWIYSQGNYDSSSNTVTLPAIFLSGSAFPPNFNAADLTQTSWGTLTFTFTDCNTGTVSWNSSLAGYGSGSLPLTRLTQIEGTSCPQ